MTNSIEDVCGVHLVGSVPYSDCKEVFKKVSSSLGTHLRRLPDGETGVRTNWVDWQLPVLEQNPNLELVVNDAYKYTQVKQLGLSEGGRRQDLELGDIGYARVAIDSYKVFSELKATGNIPARCRFQVCLPTPLATTHLYVEPSLQADFESQYEAKLLSDLDSILAAVPHAELAVQWDTAVEFALLEGVMPTYIEDLEAGIIERLLRLASRVPDDVEMGFHLCYGDSQHRHFCEPEDTGKLVMVANGVARGLSRRLHWIHLPVPKGRSDEDYFRPLANLELDDDTELYLGLVHYSDGEEGARKRIDSAAKFVSKFGVATECGFGRRPQGTLAGLMSIHTAVSLPVS